MRYFKTTEADNLVSEGCEFAVFDYIVGTTSEIKAICKAIRRGYDKEVTCVRYAYCDEPKFSEHKSVYAIAINYDNKYYIVDSDMFLYMLVEHEVEEVTRIECFNF